MRRFYTGRSSTKPTFDQAVVNEGTFWPWKVTQWSKTRFVDERPNWAHTKSQVDDPRFWQVVNEGHFYPGKSSMGGLFDHKGDPGWPKSRFVDDWGPPRAATSKTAPSQRRRLTHGHGERRLGWP